MAIFLLVLGCILLVANLLVDCAIAQFNARSQGRRPHPVGDISCQYNARSPLLRCAVKPRGPCRCEHYQPRALPR